jgi:hypothetical protein
MTGRPTIYSEDMAKRICQRLASGESLRSICRDDDMPAKSTVLLWVVTPDHPFLDHYSRAREASGFAHADRSVDIVDQVVSGELEPNAARVALSGLQWAAERMAPKKHSPRQELTGPEGRAMEVNRIEIVPGAPDADHGTD